VPSRSESFGLVALEAQACGVPVIASSVGGLRYVVADGESGYLVPAGDRHAFADRLLRVLGRLRSPDRLAAGARRQASRFSWERTADLVHEVYGELVPELAGAGADAAAEA
jgi:D-inositol-3-phosphate glycosyltransferase